MRRRLWALFRKELRSLFASPIAYIVLTAFVSLSAIFFFQHLSTYNRLLFVFHSEQATGSGFDAGTVPIQVNIREELFIPAANDFTLMLLVLIPLVTMRVFADEKAHGTDELLLTTPLRPWEVAVAKHAASYGFVLMMLAVSAIYPAVAIQEGRLGLWHLVALLLGQFAFATAVASIGLACSSLTRSQIVAAVLGYAIPFVLLDFGWLEPVLSAEVAQALRQLSLQPHVDSFARGLIESGNLVYFAAIVAVGYTISLSSLELGRAR
jgi:ABC-2 type transport system permease protein